jgi:hypothetical protein
VSTATPPQRHKKVWKPHPRALIRAKRILLPLHPTDRHWSDQEAAEASGLSPTLCRFALRALRAEGAILPRDRGPLPALANQASRPLRPDEIVPGAPGRAIRPGPTRKERREMRRRFERLKERRRPAIDQAKRELLAVYQERYHPRPWKNASAVRASGIKEWIVALAMRELRKEGFIPR